MLQILDFVHKYFDFLVFVFLLFVSKVISN